MADWRNRWIKPKTMFAFHAWMGLIVGICMVLVGFSGAIAVFKNEIEWLLTPEARAKPSAAQVSIDEIIASLADTHPEYRLSMLYPQLGPRWAHSAYIVNADGARFRVFIDPQSGEVTKKYLAKGYTQSISYFLRQFHVRLLMGSWGRVFVGVFGVTLFLSAVTGLYIYRNWIKSLFQLRRGAARRIFYSDLHKVIGFWSLIFILIVGFTGAVLGLENLYHKARNEWYPKTKPKPIVVSEEKLASYGADPQPLAVSQLLAASAQHFPNMRPLAISFPNKPERPVVIYGDHRHALIAKGRSRVYLDPYSGEILKADDPRTAPVGSKIYNTFDPLHFGYWGDAFGVEFGYAIKSVWFILGMTPGILAITGAVMWFIRRQRIKKRGPIPVQRTGESQVFTENVQEGQPVTVEEREYATVQSAPTAKNIAAPKKRPWLCFSLSCVPFLIIGYIMQATLWREGWTLTETFLQHWIIKPVSIGVVVFPITTVLVIISYRTVRSVKQGKRSALFAMVGGTLLGIWYLFLLSLLN